MFWVSIKKIGVPKDRIIAAIEMMDADVDGFVTIGEAWDMLKAYAKKVKESARFQGKH